MTIGIAGLGIIGGSFARAIKAKTAHTVLGWNRSPEVLDRALDDGAIDAVLTEENLFQCDLILVALPPKALAAWVERMDPFIRPGAVLVDACGVKRGVEKALRPLAEAYGFLYVGGHPMAGKEVSGYAVSSASLYEGASMILTPPEGLDSSVLVLLRGFFLSLGFGRVTLSDPAEHDRVIAYTSQLCHVASSAFVKSPTALLHAGFSAGSFRDLTRVARLDEALWTELFFENDDYLAQELEGYIASLQRYLDALRAGDREGMRALLREGRERKEQCGR